MAGGGYRRTVQPRLIPQRGAVLRAAFTSLFSFFLHLCSLGSVGVHPPKPPAASAEEGGGGEMGRLKLFVGGHFTVEGKLEYKGGTMHLWKVNENDFNYDDLVDYIHEMEFRRAEKIHYRVPKTKRDLDTSLIILHSKESFANLAKHLKKDNPIEVYVEHVVDDISASSMPIMGQGGSAGTNTTDMSVTEHQGSVQDADATGPSNPVGL
ncbi:hypothetical protein J5N97_009476 [Dioscorea zingiberensis]|uniref:PB1-like domain-containing protein n=1 Tax=Dioscorea zingiberensis TaxID=325984 RepID=A0A9D5CX86_9LILI|nr:hypothetical protein J5N97_009476 [Dioscorea zingiberensis]